MIVKPIKTRPLLPPKDDFFSVLKESLKALKENSVVVITSKIVSIGEGRCIKIEEKVNKDDLIKKEADWYLEREKSPGGHVMLTIKDDLFVPSAGIDESNANGYYILWPKDPYHSAKNIHQFIKKQFGLKNFGVIISDSRSTPLRRGTLGYALAFWGFKPLKDYRGKPDIFGRALKITQANLADALVAAAVVVMGEGSEATPLAVISDVDFVEFGDFDFLKDNPLKVAREEDIYAPFLNAVDWKRRERFQF